MNWFRAKTILIVLFFCINIFLLTNMLITTNKAIVIDDSTINNTVEVLEKNNIIIDKEIILRKIKNYSLLKIENVLTQNNEILDGKDNPKATIEGSYIEYSKPINEGTFTSEEVVTNYVKKLIKDFGLKTKHINIENIIKTGDGYIVICKYNYKGMKIFDADIKIMIGKELNVQGYFIKPVSFSPRSYSANNITSRLIKFMGAEKVNEKNSIRIMDISLGYLPTKDDLRTDFKDMLIMPVWRITTDSNNIYYYDAIKTSE